MSGCGTGVRERTDHQICFCESALLRGYGSAENALRSAVSGCRPALPELEDAGMGCCAEYVEMNREIFE